MPRYLIERNIPGASNLTGEELKAIAKKSNDVVAGLGEPYVWDMTYVAGDKLYCVHEAESAEAVYRHASEGGFPADLVSEIKVAIGPATADKAPF